MSDPKEAALQAYFMDSWKIVRGLDWAQAISSEDMEKTFTAVCDIVRKTIERVGADIVFHESVSDHAFHWLAIFKIDGVDEELVVALPWMKQSEIGPGAVSRYIYDSMAAVLNHYEKDEQPVLGVASMRTVCQRSARLEQLVEQCPRCTSDIRVGSTVVRYDPNGVGTRIFQEVTVSVEEASLELEVEWPTAICGSAS